MVKHSVTVAAVDKWGHFPWLLGELLELGGVNVWVNDCLPSCFSFVNESQPVQGAPHLSANVSWDTFHLKPTCLQNKGIWGDLQWFLPKPRAIYWLTSCTKKLILRKPYCVDRVRMIQNTLILATPFINEFVHMLIMNLFWIYGCHL